MTEKTTIILNLSELIIPPPIKFLTSSKIIQPNFNKRLCRIVNEYKIKIEELVSLKKCALILVYLQIL